MKPQLLFLTSEQTVALITCLVVTGCLVAWRILHAPQARTAEHRRCKSDFVSLSSNISYALWTQYNFYDEQIDDFFSEFKGKVDDHVLSHYAGSLRKQLRTRMYAVRPLAAVKK